MRNVSVFCALPLAVFAATYTTRHAKGALERESHKVSVAGREGHWRLERDGKPFLIKGFGGTGSPSLAVKLGANSFRTWGADNLKELLDNAQKDGLLITAGIWLGHADVFDYHNPETVAKQRDMCLQVVRQFKDHPALLMWSFGNEMEGYGKADDSAVWTAIEDIAHSAKLIDPNHPMMTVISELGGERVKNVHKYCPSLDVVGINSYAGAPTLATRYRALGGVKPYVVTEFGPPGPWESAKTRWGAPLELSSTEKAEHYRSAYVANVVQQSGLCLGAYAFLWGHKQETTSTWFGMLLSDGSWLASAAEMGRSWGTKGPTLEPPVINGLSLAQSDHLTPGQSIMAKLSAEDKGGRRLTVKWSLIAESSATFSGGLGEAALPEFPEALSKASIEGVTIRVPKSGAYRLFVTVYNGTGGAATANIPIFVD